MPKWAAQIPQTPAKNRRKRCYYCWVYVDKATLSSAGVVWLTPGELSRYLLAGHQFEEVLERDLLNYYSKHKSRNMDKIIQSGLAYYEEFYES